MEVVFDQIYERAAWGAAGDGSGPGSEPAKTVALRAVLTKIVRERGVTTLVDAPCGACKWTRVWLEELTRAGVRLKYVGVDISATAIDRARANLAGLEHDVELRMGDIAAPLDACDLLLCRDALQHLSLQDATGALQNIFATPAKTVLLGGYLTGGPNRNIVTGEYYSINYTRPPFSLAPVAIHRELHDGVEPTKYLFEFTKSG